MSQTQNGYLDVLNIGAGHLKFQFNKSQPEEVEKAKKVLTDMLKRGYMLFVLVNGEQKRVRKFDAELEEYILEEPDIPEVEEVRIGLDDGPKLKSPRRGRLPLRSAKATGIGPTAGG